MYLRVGHLAVLASLALLLSACTPRQAPAPSAGSDPASTAGAGAALTVTSTAQACTVSASTVASGTHTFTIRNDGAQTTEFYVLGADGLRVVGEKENIPAGTTAALNLQLQPGTYFTACKPGMRGDNVGQAAFTVTGEPITLSGDDAALFAGVVTDYVNFVKNEVAALVPEVEKFSAAYAAGDDDAAKKQFPAARVHYERIEPIAEALGILDARIDYREIDYLAEADALRADDPTFTQWLGFHRMEKDLWVPAANAVQPDGTPAHEGWTASTPAERKQLAETLNADVKALYDVVHDPDFVAEQQLDVAAVSNGASALLEEIAVNKVTGEEDWWSHTDLYDFAANLQGARVAFDLVSPIAERTGAEGTALVAEINDKFDRLSAQLDSYGSLEKGFVSYDTVSRDEQRKLVAAIDAAREPLSKLTGTVLGIGA